MWGSSVLLRVRHRVRCNSGVKRLLAWVWPWRWQVAGALFVVALFGVLYAQLPWWIDGERLRRLADKDQTGPLSGDRGDVLKMFAGFGGLVALFYTARKHSLDRQAHALDREGHALSEQGQVTDRYGKAIGQLASDKLEERLGGIYALERVMADSVRDHPTVVEVLAAFVRAHAPAIVVGEADLEPTSVPDDDSSGETALPIDIAAAMAVLSRRPKREEPFRADLKNTCLTNLWLDKAGLARVSLVSSDVSLAMLRGADLTDALLFRANLSGSELTGATLIDASLVEADLRFAVLGGTDLTRADCRGTDFGQVEGRGTCLASANLRDANFSGASLYKADFRHARADHATFVAATIDCANLSGAEFRDADFTGADLGDSDLTGADFDGAILSKASLVGTNLTGAYLCGARLSKADLTGARLGNADLTGARYLVARQLAGALITEETRLDPPLAGDPWVKARLEDCASLTPDNPVPPPTPRPGNANTASSPLANPTTSGSNVSVSGNSTTAP